MADQTSDFEAIVNKCKSAMIDRPSNSVTYNEKQKTWTKRMYAPSSVTYDVFKTNSLITPFFGYIEIIETATLKSAPDEETAKDAALSIEDYSTPALLLTTRVDYSYGSGGWLASGLTSTTAFRQIGQFRFDTKTATPIRYAQGKIPKLSAPLGECIQ
jgi:hypothetical protein